MRTWSDRWACW